MANEQPTPPTYDATGALELFMELRAKTDIAYVERVKTKAAIDLLTAVARAASAAGLEARRLSSDDLGCEYSFQGTDLKVALVGARDSGVWVDGVQVDGITFVPARQAWVPDDEETSAATLLAQRIVTILAG